MNDNLTTNQPNEKEFVAKNKGSIRKTIFALLASFIAAMAIWFFAIGAAAPMERVFYGVVVELQNADRLRIDHDLSVISGSNVQIYVVLRGQRAVISRLTNDDITAFVNLMDYPTADTHEARIRFDWPPDITFVRSSMGLTTITIDRTINESVPLTIVPNHSTEYPYFEASRTSMPTDIIVTGPADLVRRVEHARITLEPMGNLTTTVNLTIPSEQIELFDANNNRIESSHVSIQTGTEIAVTINIAIRREIPLRVNFIHGVLNQNNSNMTISPQSIIVTGSPTAVRELGEYILLDTIDDHTILTDSRFTLPIRVPAGINIGPVAGWDSPLESAEVNIELQNVLRPINIPVANIEITNPLGREIAFASNNFRVELRVDRELANRITIDDVLLSVDLTPLGTALGEHTVPIEVTFTPQFDGRAYVVRTEINTNIRVALSEPPPEEPTATG